ncbi:uncharacterized protein TNCV_2358551 [Trichonephila clavipes]|nr:uncharacterized protein TNCV_2358551 [Trichonephila clavipes]
MRGRILQPEHCIEYYRNQIGNGDPYFSSDFPILRGYGFFCNLRRCALPLMIQAGKYLGKRLLTSGRNIVEQVSQGKSFRNAARDQLRQSEREITTDILRKLKEGGIRKDVDRSLNPTNTSESREGPLTYLDYYKKQYDITIQDLNQPALLCRSKEKEIRGGASVSKTVYPIPELRCTTGTTDPMRPVLTTIRKMSNRLKMWIGRRIKLKQMHPEMYLNKPATAKKRGREGRKILVMHQREPTSRVPPLGRGARGEGMNTEEKGADEKFSDGVNRNEWTAASARGGALPSIAPAHQ